MRREMVAYADLILPDTTYLERHDCISLLDRPISEPDAAGDAIRWPVMEPDRDVRGFQSVLLDLGRAAGPAGDGRTRTARRSSSRLCRLHREPPAPPGRRAADGLSGQWRRLTGRGAPNPEQMDALYRERRASFRRMCRTRRAFFKPWNAAYQDWAVATGLLRDPAALSVQHLVRTDAPVPAGGRGHGPSASRPTHLRARLKQAMDPLPVWYAPFGDEDAALAIRCTP